MLLRITGKFDDPDIQIDFIYDKYKLEANVKRVIEGIVGK